MLMSMTGFARGAADCAWGTATWEIRSVNHRYLDVTFRLPESLAELEPKLRTLAQQHIKRGKVEANLKIQLTQPQAKALQFNHEVIEQIVQIYQHYSQMLPNAQLDFAKLLTWQGSMQQTDLNLAFLHEDIYQLFQSTLQQFKQMRQTEGQAIMRFLAERLDAILQQVQLATHYLPEVLEQGRAKLQNRLAELQQELDGARLEQEMVILAQRLDVAEELDRLQQHVIQINGLILQEEVVGRRLDFLMQELNREANTLSSKANDIRMTQAAVEIKVLVEQMREQVQNIE